MTFTKITDDVLCGWIDEAVEDPLILERNGDTLILHQYEDQVHIQRENLPVILKLCKELMNGK